MGMGGLKTIMYGVDGLRAAVRGECLFCRQEVYARLLLR